MGDLAIQILSEESVIVSLYETIGSLLIISQLAKSSYKSFRQISTCNSPHPAIMCYPLSSVEHITKGSDFESFFNPSTNLGKS